MYWAVIKTISRIYYLVFLDSAYYYFNYATLYLKIFTPGKCYHEKIPNLMKNICLNMQHNYYKNIYICNTIFFALWSHNLHKITRGNRFLKCDNATRAKNCTNVLRIPIYWSCTWLTRWKHFFRTVIYIVNGIDVSFV